MGSQTKEELQFKKVIKEGWHTPLLLLQTKKNEIEEGRKVDHIIDMKETNGQDQIFVERFENLDYSYIKSTTIFKVTAGMSESNPDAYKPKLISIGPYHEKNPELQSMEKYKLLYLRQFLRRKERIDVESCISDLEELKDEALKCYDINLVDLDNGNTNDFLQMLLLDGCFVVEFVRERFGMRPKGEEKIINTSCIANQVRRDLLLLENQLPFFVLTKLHDMTKEVNEEPFTTTVQYTFLPYLLKINRLQETVGNEKNIKHLLHVVHMSCQPTRNPTMDAEHSSNSLYYNPFQQISSKEKPKDKVHIKWHKVTPNATELYEAGVRFVKVGYIYSSLEENDLGEDTDLFAIKFEDGVMKIPCFQVIDSTESLMRNLIAYEQQSSDVHPRYFSDYAVFMDYLIDSDKDVSLLRRKGIIENWIGSEDKEVASIFNKIGKGVAVSVDDFYYKEECLKAAQHCKTKWNRMKASLKRNYFNSPWTGASTVAAIVLLILTAMQTVLAFTGGVKK